MKHKICPMSITLIRIGCTAVSKQLIVNHLLFVKYCVILTSFWKSESLSQSLAPMSPVDEIMRHFQLTWLINRPPSRGGDKRWSEGGRRYRGKRKTWHTRLFSFLSPSPSACLPSSPERSLIPRWRFDHPEVTFKQPFIDIQEVSFRLFLNGNMILTFFSLSFSIAAAISDKWKIAN